MVISTMCNPGIMVHAANWIFTVDTVSNEVSIQAVRQNNFLAENSSMKMLKCNQVCFTQKNNRDVLSTICNGCNF